MGRFYNITLYSDHFKVYPDRFAIKKARLFKMWFNLVKKRGYMTTADFIEAFPDFATRIAIWHECMDDEGKPTLNPKKYGAHIAKCMTERQKRKAVYQ